MNNILVLLLSASICSLLDPARGEEGVAIPADGSAATYWAAQYPWCATGSTLFVCKRNVRIVPIEGSDGLL